MSKIKVGSTVTFEVSVGRMGSRAQHTETREGEVTGFDFCPFTGLRRATIQVGDELSPRKILAFRLKKL